MTGIYEVETRLFDEIENLDWWEVETETKPILETDNFAKLDLKITHGREEKIRNLRKFSESQHFKKQLAEKLEDLFSRQGTIRNLKYNVKLKTTSKCSNRKEGKSHCMSNQQSEKCWISSSNLDI